MTLDELPKILKLLQQLHDSGEPKVAAGCLQVLEAYPKAHEFWFLRSQSLLFSNFREDALEDVVTACILDPSNLNYWFHQFRVLMELNRANEIPILINQRMHLVKPEDMDNLLGFVEESLKCGAFSKHELSDDVAIELLRKRNRE